MQGLIGDYFKAIDILALAAIVGIAVVSFRRTGAVALLCTAVIVAIWGAFRILGVE